MLKFNQLNRKSSGQG